MGSNEEPKPFQTVRVKQITMHPAYQPTNLESDVALLHLENDLKFDKHIGAICVDENELEPTQGSDEECVTSGWGKEIIKCKPSYHAHTQFRFQFQSIVSYLMFIVSLFHCSFHRSRCRFIASFPCNQPIECWRMSSVARFIQWKFSCVRPCSR